MTTTLQITVTKDILEKSKNCINDITAGHNCAVALAIRDIFPKARVGSRVLYFYDSHHILFDLQSYLPACASKYIRTFDSLRPHERAHMPEITFEIEIPDNVLNTINIEEIKPLLQNHPSLKLVTQ